MSNLQGLLDTVPDLSLIEAVRSMDGMAFLDGTTHQRKSFNANLCITVSDRSINSCLHWAKSNKVPDSVKAKRDKNEMTVDQVAVIRAYTCTPICYALREALTERQANWQQALPCAKLLLTALRRLPAEFCAKPSTVYRGETGQKADLLQKSVVTFYGFTSFSLDPAVLQRFMQNNDSRTMYEAQGARGYIIQKFSAFPSENELLLEPGASFTVTQCDGYSPDHILVKSGQISPGLIHVKCEHEQQVSINMLMQGPGAVSKDAAKKEADKAAAAKAAAAADKAAVAAKAAADKEAAEKIETGKSAQDLYEAAERGDRAMVQALCVARPEWAKVCHWYYNHSPLFIAAYNGHLEVVKYLYEVCPEMTKVKNINGYTPLEVASRNGYTAVAAFLQGK